MAINNYDNGGGDGYNNQNGGDNNGNRNRNGNNGNKRKQTIIILVVAYINCINSYVGTVREGYNKRDNL